MIVTRRSHAFGTVWQPRALAVLLTVTALLVGFSTAAAAHDVLVGTAPADGSTTAVVPARVMLTFSEPVLAVGTLVIVKGPSGSVQSGKAVLAGSTITQRLQPDSPAGKYTVLWRATSPDGHPVSGKLTFTATSASAGQHATTSTSTTSTSTTSTSTTGSTPHRTPPSTVATALARTSTTTGTSTSASAAGNAAIPWWVLVAGITLVLLGLAFLFTRRLRPTPPSDPDPRP